MHSFTEENYLKAIFHLSQKGDMKITPTAIAEEIGVNAASVVDMIKKLKEKNLIQYDKSSGAKLTVNGNSIALGVIRNHRLWEVFLMEKLEYSWDVVHEIAEQLEHVKHDELANRLDKFLGFPEFDPHGDPIPNANGEIPSVANILLSELESGKSCQVASIRDTSVLFLQYLEQLAITIGTKIKVIETIPFDESMIILIDGVQRTVSKKLANNLMVH